MIIDMPSGHNVIVERSLFTSLTATLSRNNVEISTL